MPPAPFNLRRPLLLFTLAALYSTTGVALAKPSKAESRDLKREMIADTTGAKPSKRDDPGSAKGGRSTPADAQARIMAKLRERLDVNDDAEWDIISNRIARVDELRRNLWTGSAGSRGSPSMADKSKRSSKSAHPEQDALRSALGDKLPDAEIEVRLARAREVYREAEFRLAKAQAELRAVLTVRQEAEAVVIGLLPP
ncbi:MAG: hypothetical protein EXS37_06520 [Opitutus sp.]|nr:hypothetical protein [Opitutus sp.]